MKCPYCQSSHPYSKMQMHKVTCKDRHKATKDITELPVSRSQFQRMNKRQQMKYKKAKLTVQRENQNKRGEIAAFQEKQTQFIQKYLTDEMDDFQLECRQYHQQQAYQDDVTDEEYYIPHILRIPLIYETFAQSIHYGEGKLTMHVDPDDPHIANLVEFAKIFSSSIDMLGASLHGEEEEDGYLEQFEDEEEGEIDYDVDREYTLDDRIQFFLENDTIGRIGLDILQMRVDSQSTLYNINITDLVQHTMFSIYCSSDIKIDDIHTLTLYINEHNETKEYSSGDKLYYTSDQAVVFQ